MHDKMEKNMFWLDNSLLSVLCYFGNHTSYTIIQAKVLASVKDKVVCRFIRTSCFSTGLQKTAFVKLLKSKL